MVDFALAVIQQIGLVGAGLLIALEVVIPPIPSEVVLLLSGFNSAVGTFSLAGAIIATTLGSLLGASVLYFLGYFFSLERVETIINRFGKYLGVTTKDFQKTMKWFEKYGSALVFFGRLIPIIRSLVSIPAGLVKMNYFRFLVFTALGSGIWNSIWILLGFLLGENWQVAEQYSVFIDYLAYALVGGAVIYIIFRAIKYWPRGENNKA